MTLALLTLLAAPALAQDGDGDGYDVADGDCDDTNAAVHPGAEEVCEGNSAGQMPQVDNDCDGSVNSWGGVYPYNGDDGSIETWEGNPWGSTYYRDADLDGFGDADMTYALCEPQTGFMSSFGDCDDTDAGVNPGMSEICDGRDENCDNQIDEPDNLTASGSGCVTLYPDADLDGFGDERSALCMCYDGVEDLENGCPAGYEFDGVETCYTSTIGDCYDDDDEIRPRFTDDHPLHLLFPDAPEYQPESAADWGEALDGDDNDCDDLVPLAEIDCDGDGVLAALPSGLDYNEPFATSADLGLDACDPTTPPALTCEGEVLEPLCDEATGIWMLRTAGYRYEGGHRRYEDLDTTYAPDFEHTGDCDDLCAERSPNLGEACDGIDNDCAGDSDDVYAYVDTDGVPDPMSPEAERAGYVSAGEVDLDGDGYLGCADFTDYQQDHLADLVCDTSYLDDGLLGDCAPHDPDAWLAIDCPVDRPATETSTEPGGCGCSGAGGAGGAWLIALLGLARRRYTRARQAATKAATEP